MKIIINKLQIAVKMNNWLLLKTFFIIILQMLLLNSCVNSPLGKALKMAGDNRVELEKVLQHYSQNEGDSLKYRATCFLLENIPYHYCFGGEGIQNYKYVFDSLIEVKNLTKSDLMDEINNIRLDRQKLTIERDINNITADYLIAHIDSAFVALEYPWNKELNFEDFCEYVLPYRLGNELLDNWVAYYRHYHAVTINSLLEQNADRYTAITTMFDSLNKIT